MLILSEHNIGHMSNEELLMTVIKEYADPSNWESYEKDMTGDGRLSTISPVMIRDRGAQAERVLEIIKSRKKDRPTTGAPTGDEFVRVLEGMLCICKPEPSDEIPSGWPDEARALIKRQKAVQS